MMPDTIEVVIAASTRMFGNLLQRDLLRDEADDQRIDARDRAGLGRGEHAGQDAADDDQRCEQAGPCRSDRMPQRAQIEARRHLAQLRILRVIGVELHGRHQREADQDAGDDAAEEQPADRDLRDRAIDDHRHARRDDRAHRPGGRDQGGGEARLVAGLLHRRDDDRSDRRRVGGRRAGDAGHHHAADDRGVREPGAEMADQRAREIDELPADAARRHDRAGKDEVGHRQQREGVELREHFLREQRHHHVAQHRHADEADQRDRQQDRDADQHHAEQRREQEGDHGAATSGGSSSGSGGGNSPVRRRTTTNSRYTLPRIIP